MVPIEAIEKANRTELPTSSTTLLTKIRLSTRRKTPRTANSHNRCLNSRCLRRLRETSYIKLATQLFGDRMVIANATGCSSIYGGSYPSTVYTKNAKGVGPAWANSLFEDNAEFGFGMKIASEALHQIQVLMEQAIEKNELPEMQPLFEKWMQNRNSSEITKEVRDELVPLLEKSNNPIAKRIFELKDNLVKRSQWIIGGDGWAYDIGYGGLDHVIANNEDVNILVLDTEVYSNTGGQSESSQPSDANHGCR